MIILVLAVLGLILGSFVNALVYRVHEQSKPRKKAKKDLSIVNGRSICPHCKHELAPIDLVPVFSWLMLRGRCRYCHKSIGWQYPLVEAITAVLFVTSYLFWPMDWNALGIVNFAVWLIMLAGFMALIVYDIRWMLLPNRIIYPLMGLALLMAVVNIAYSEPPEALISLLASVAIAGGIFYALFAISGGRWIGGGDVKLGALIGLLLADPSLSFFMLLLASTLGTIFVLPGLLLRRLNTSNRIPFGPFLIIAAIIVKLFGAAVIEWYRRSLLIEV